MKLRTPLKIRRQGNPWNEIACGFPALQINEFKVTEQFANKKFELHGKFAKS